MFQNIPTRAFHAMAKPSGSDCNLNCAYCFYLEKHALYNHTPQPRMTDAMLERYVRDYIASVAPEAEVAFTWQGGEPTLLGLEFYRRAVALQAKYGAGRQISNSFQTNGVLLDDAWCEFFVRHHFLIGLSLDGPEEIHNEYRLTKGGRPTHKLVMRALALLQQHGVEYNVLACVNRRSARSAEKIYDFFVASGVEFIQFIPVVERLADESAQQSGLTLHAPGDACGTLTDWSVIPEDYGRFLCAVFDRWITHDVGKVFVMNIEWAFANFVGAPGTVCHHQPTCGRSVVVEHNGDVYACDHYVYPQFHLGNLNEQTFAAMLDSPQQEAFGKDKYTTLPEQCRQCPVLRACWGGCPKHRFALTKEGKPGLNYLCAGFRAYFQHLPPYLKAMADLVAMGRPASDIMHAHLHYAKSDK
ncbi:anaerobic sulfatase maturase [Salmonella enterica]|uniref:Anaerobic sulfatase maturase n=1 Tax=Salmonella enterica TaxID=28901 RepID=A0A701YVY3_SALER|nr:anaerobic sulfatase maturase [Salmonella enterica]HAC6564937.1 anaerobic sulfatase maturase [Salmonella enterica subsp. indica]HCM1935555.1 anaerobic sulfatase maturase [Salmonella enterica subsp. indica serovar 6,7:z41:1,7]